VVILEKREQVTRVCSDGKEKRVTRNRNSLIFNALQDGLGFKKMKFIETFRNHKKLKYR
jgi:hypothetical protein